MKTKTRLAPRLVALAGALVVAAHAADVSTTHDVVVYGGTSGGITAAVAAARHGARTILIEPGRHVGGLTSGGLGATDMGKKETIGGLAREFYRRVKAHYADPAKWKHGKPDEFRSSRHEPAEDAMFYFEPHVAEKIYHDLLREAKVELVLGERLDLKSGVRRGIRPALPRPRVHRRHLRRRSDGEGRRALHGRARGELRVQRDAQRQPASSAAPASGPLAARFPTRG
jgi:glycine/D-amino acid oxidase-like deaminating enzyme